MNLGPLKRGGLIARTLVVILEQERTCYTVERLLTFVFIDDRRTDIHTLKEAKLFKYHQRECVLHR